MPLRLVAGLLDLQRAFALSDEAVVVRSAGPPYGQHFCEETCSQHWLLTETIAAGQCAGAVSKFLSTPLDLLGVSILDLMGALSLKVAAIDGVIDPREFQVIRDYFVEDWGYDPDYVDHALAVLNANEDKARLVDMTRALAEFVRGNPDCKFAVLQYEIKQLLTEVAEADGKLDEREEMVIERIPRSLDEQNSIMANLSRAAKGAGNATSSAVEWVGGMFGRNNEAE